MKRFIVGWLVLLSVACHATDVSAHASLLQTEPADGSVLASAPDKVELRFNEAVVPAVIKLIDATGRTRDDAKVATHDHSIVIALPPGLPQGTQVLSYRVISQDGHPVGGSTTFSIGVVTGASAAPTATGAVAAMIWLARIGVYLGLFVGIGGAFFRAWISRKKAGTGVVVTAFAAGLISVVISIGLQGLDLLNLPLGDLLLSSSWRAGLSTSLGPSLLVAVAAMVAGVVSFAMTSVKTARAVALLAMAGVGVSLALTGHAATASPQWLTRPAVFVHGIGVAFWVGALVPLAVMAKRRDPTLLNVLHRFSRAAMLVVGVLVLTGLLLAIVQLDHVSSLIETGYGLILSVKLVLVALLLGLAALNRYRLTPVLVSHPAATRPLVRSIVAECVIALAILAAVAGWRFTPPPRLLPSAEMTPLAVHIHTESAMFQVLVSPGLAGANDFVLQLMEGDASPLSAKEATLILNLPDRSIEPHEYAATLGPDGYWHVRNVMLPYPGRWHMRIEALVSDFQKVSLEDDLDVPAN